MAKQYINNTEELPDGGLVVKIEEKTRALAYVDVRVFVAGKEIKGLKSVTFDSKSVKKINELYERDLPKGD